MQAYKGIHARRVPVASISNMDHIAMSAASKRETPICMLIADLFVSVHCF